MKKTILLLLGIFLIVGIIGFFLKNNIGKFESVGIAKKNSENLIKVKIGMSKQEVLGVMGRPSKVEAYSWNNQIIEFLLYRTKGFDFYLKDKEDNFTPIAIDNQSSKVINWDRKFYKEVTARLTY
jgi:uncharacterized protein (UPF0333 family)